MEFDFDLRPLFNQPIVKLSSTLVPSGFNGSIREGLQVSVKFGTILHVVGEASAKAQGLKHAVTTAPLFRSKGHKAYIAADVNEGKNGVVLGLLKVGVKTLYLTDRNGETNVVQTPCVLDFYVAESRQRTGIGRTLFDTMLQEEEYEPIKMAIDRPSDKLLGFLRKHYGLEKTIPQVNNFVIFDGFFERLEPDQINNDYFKRQRMYGTGDMDVSPFGRHCCQSEHAKRSEAEQNASSPIGRYAAPRPLCSMAEIIHNTASPTTQKPNRES